MGNSMENVNSRGLDKNGLLCDALARGQMVSLRATSRSMLPIIEPGDRLLVRGEAYAVGDIVAAVQDGQWVTHFVVAECTSIVALAGQGQSFRAEVPRAAVHGRVIAVQRGTRTWWLHVTASCRRVMSSWWR